METENVEITSGVWHPVLTNGGSCIVQGASAAIRVLITQSAAPAIDVAALHYEEFQTRDGLNFNDLPSGTRVFIRTGAGTAKVTVVK